MEKEDNLEKEKVAEEEKIPGDIVNSGSNADSFNA